MPMNNSDRVRDHAFKTFIEPARRLGRTHATIVAGDVAKALKLMNRLPLVCAALGTLKFQRERSITLEQRDGPSNSTTTSFKFKI
jgi:hypothetical protein